MSIGSRLTLITGGTRSGKSRHALELAEPFRHRAFVATAQPLDGEMRDRIEQHRRERGSAYETYEEPVDLAETLASLPDRVEVAVVDCLTVWLGNLVYRAEQAADAGELDLGQLDLASPESFLQIRAFLDFLDSGSHRELILVSNELGMGIVPASPLGRAFRDLAGSVNQEVARRAQRVILMVSGLPMSVKGRDDE